MSLKGTESSNYHSMSNHIRHPIIRSVEFDDLKSPEILIQKLEQILTQKRGVDLADIRSVSFDHCTVALNDKSNLPGVTATFVFFSGKKQEITYPKQIDFLWEAQNNKLDVPLNSEDTFKQPEGRESIFERLGEEIRRILQDFREVLKSI